MCIIINNCVIITPCRIYLLLHCTAVQYNIFFASEAKKEKPTYTVQYYVAQDRKTKRITKQHAHSWMDAGPNLRKLKCGREPIRDKPQTEPFYIVQ